MTTYHVWTVGCQMNVADSERMASALERLGCTASPVLEEADVIVLNSCVVRQGAEDQVAGRLSSLFPLKRRNPEKIIALMGCMVGPRTEDLERRFPHVDMFMRPQQFAPLLDLTADIPLGDGCLPAGLSLKATGPTAFVNIVHGCDNFCTFCIVPYRRGRERSRPVSEIVAEVEGLVAQGVRDVTLLGQKVDSYGHDLGDIDLAGLLHAVHAVHGLDRIRFLTSYPLGVTDRLVDTVASLPKVCEHINIPVQSGDDDQLTLMHRGYTLAQFQDRMRVIKHRLPGGSLATDVIVGFCGETEQQFQRTLDLMEAVRFDVVHVAMYSERPGTIAARTMADGVPAEVKLERLHRVEDVQARIAAELNRPLLGQHLEVLAEHQKDGRWEGRTRTNKVVHFTAPSLALQGELATVRITSTSPWSLQGDLVSAG